MHGQRQKCILAQTEGGHALLAGVSEMGELLSWVLRMGILEAGCTRAGRAKGKAGGRVVPQPVPKAVWLQFVPLHLRHPRYDPRGTGGSDSFRPVASNSCPSADSAPKTFLCNISLQRHPFANERLQ